MSKKELLAEIQANNKLITFQNEILVKILNSVNNIGILTGLNCVEELTENVEEVISNLKGLTLKQKSKLKEIVKNTDSGFSEKKMLFSEKCFYYDEETNSIFFINSFEKDIRDDIPVYVCDCWLENPEAFLVRGTVMFPQKLVDNGKLQLADIKLQVLPRLEKVLKAKGYEKSNYLDAVTKKECEPSSEMRFKWRADNTCYVYDSVTGGIIWDCYEEYGEILPENKEFINEMGDKFVLGSDATVYFGLKETNAIIGVSCSDIEFDDFKETEDRTQGYAHGWQAFKDMEESK